MTDNKTPDSSGQPIYEQKRKTPKQTTSASVKPRIQDRIAKSYEDKDIVKYGIKKPIKEIIYAKIVRQEWQETICIESEQTKAKE